jgi:DNA repair/transcription protein MET18/MMS19
MPSGEFQSPIWCVVCGSDCSLPILFRESVKVLVAFFASKLEDTETIIPALKGILAITRIPAVVPENIHDICAA